MTSTVVGAPATQHPQTDLHTRTTQHTSSSPTVLSKTVA